MIERFNQTLKKKLERIFTHKGNFVYINILQNVVNSYNNTKHSTIGIKPNLVCKKNEDIIWNNVYRPQILEEIEFKFKINDQVLIAKQKQIFEKGIQSGWVREVFHIHQRHIGHPVTYTIRDINNEIIEGKFYTEQLQKVNLKEFKIEKIIKKKNGKCMVKFYGYPDAFNKWIDSNDIIVNNHNEFLYYVTK